MSGEIFVLVEHRGGEVRDVTYEMLGKARDLAEKGGARVTALLLGHQVAPLLDQLRGAVDAVELHDDPGLAQFNSECYQQVLYRACQKRQPLLIMIGHTAFGLDLAPSLAEQLGAPLLTDATGIRMDGEQVVVERPAYAGKLVATIRACDTGAVVTVQAGAFPVIDKGNVDPQVKAGEVEVDGLQGRKQFIEYVEAATEDVDITQSDVVVSVGRGIGDPENLPMIEKLAEALGGVVACSRPVVDRKWLPRSRQVGISGKSVAAEALPGRRHQRILPAPRGNQASRDGRRDQ